jgi:hypothetical protein
MKASEFKRQLNSLCDQLDHVMGQDCRLIDPQSTQPLTMTSDQVEQYGRNYHQRQKLTEAICELANQPIEPD